MTKRFKESGAVIIEASIGILLLFSLVFVIIEFARYATMTAALQASADEALTLAQTMSGIDSADPVKRDESIEKIKEVSERIAKQTFFSNPNSAPTVKVTIPTPDIKLPQTEEQRRKELEQHPIIVELQASVPSIIGKVLGNNYIVRAKAVGFREPRNPFSEPTPLDCKGNPIAIGKPQPTNCACPGAESNPDVVYDPAIGKCRCNVPTGNLTWTEGFPPSFLESGLEYDPATATCKCPGDWVNTDPSNGEPAGKCKCGFTDESCESFNRDYRGLLGPGAHVKTRFNGYNVCQCAEPCKGGNPSNWYALADSSWDPANQRCECVRPPNWQELCQDAYKAMHHGVAYTGNFGMGERCNCTTCGLGQAQDEADVLTNDYPWGCDCTKVATPCADPAATRMPYYGCQCTCPGETPYVQLPDGTIKCAPPGCRRNLNSCYYDADTHTIKVCEAGGLCSNPLPFMPMD